MNITTKIVSSNPAQVRCITWYNIMWYVSGFLYLCLWTMSHTIYAAKFEQTIIHQHVHLRWESQSHASAHVLMRLYPIDKSHPDLHPPLLNKYIINSNMTSFFRFVNIWAIYRLGIISLAHAPMHVTDFLIVNVHADELSSARIWQHKLWLSRYLSYIVAVTALLMDTRVSGENHWHIT
jgi:hypothetical protein